MGSFIPRSLNFAEQHVEADIARGKKIVLNERDRDALEHLLVARTIAYDLKGWLTPMFLGGRDGSHHSNTLKKLVKQGLVERKERGGFTKSSWLYRITPKGRAAFGPRGTR